MSRVEKPSSQGNDVSEPNRKKYTVDEIINNLGLGYFQIYLFFYCGVLCMSESCDMMLVCLLLPVLREKWDLSGVREALLGIVVLMGNFVGSILYGYLSDKIGRMPSIWIAVTTTLFFSILSACFDNYYVFLVLRFFVGIYVGSVIVPHALLLEYLPTKGRGIILALFSFGWTWGTIYEAMLGWAVLPYFGSQSWQWYVGLSCIPLFAMVPFTICVPESLRFLCILENKESWGKNQRRMKKIVRRMERWNCSELTREEYDIETVQPEEYETWFLLELWRKPGLLFLFVNLCVFNCGGNFLYNGFMIAIPDIFNQGDVNDAGNMIYLGNLLNTLVEIPAIIFLTFIVVLYPRKAVQFSSFFVGAWALLMLAIPIQSNWWKISFSLLSRGSFVVTISMLYILSQESLPTNIRGRGFGIAFALGNVFSAFSPLVVKLIGLPYPSLSFLILMGVSVVSGVSTLLHPMETKGRDIKQIEEESPVPDSIVKKTKEFQEPLLERKKDVFYTPGKEGKV